MRKTENKNRKRQMVEFAFGFFEGKEFGADYNTLRENLNLRDALLYASAANDRKWYECGNADILYALRKSCKELIGCDNYTVYIQVYLMRGYTFPTMAVDFKIEVA